MGQLDVLDDGFVLVPLRLDRVGSGQDGGARVERADDAGLGDGERLLLHDLVQHGPRALVHLVELVNAAHTIVAQHQRASVNGKMDAYLDTRFQQKVYVMTKPKLELWTTTVSCVEVQNLKLASSPFCVQDNHRQKKRTC